MLFMIYSDKSAFNIVSQLKLNNVKIDSEMNAVFKFLKIFCSCSVHHYETSSVNFIKNTVIFVKDLMNC